MLEQFASKIIDMSKTKKYSIDFSLSFSFIGVTFSISGKERIVNINSLIEKMLEELKRRNIKVLISIDDVSKNSYLKVFTQEYQYLLRNNYRVFLLMTGLYNNIYDLQNDKSLTFLLRTPKISISPLSMPKISIKYKEIFNIDKKDSDNLAIITKGYAFCFQLLGSILYESNRIRANDEILDKLDQALFEYYYQKIYIDLSDIDKKIISVFKENRIYQAEEIMEKANINLKMYSQYRDRLIKRGILASKGYGKLELLLPRFNEVIEKFTFI